MKIVALLVSIVLLAGCGQASDDEYEDYPTDGWVKVWEEDDVYKRCDGTTLIYYYDGNITFPPDSSECES